MFVSVFGFLFKVILLLLSFFFFFFLIFGPFCFVLFCLLLFCVCVGWVGCLFWDFYVKQETLFLRTQRESLGL
jgi:hypothetical protein